MRTLPCVLQNRPMLLPVCCLLLLLFQACSKEEESPYTDQRQRYELQPGDFFEQNPRGYVEVKGLKTGGIEIRLEMVGTLDGARHPVHLHEGSLADGGNMLAYLSYLEDVGNGKSESITRLEELPNDATAMTFDRFVTFDGCIKVHLDEGEYKKVVIGSTNIGSNATP